MIFGRVFRSTVLCWCILLLDRQVPSPVACYETAERYTFGSYGLRRPPCGAGALPPGEEPVKCEHHEGRFLFTNGSSAFQTEEAIEEREIWHSQTTTTLVRFGGQGAPDEELLEPRIDRYSSVEWLAEESGFKPNLRTVFILHGYMSFSMSQVRWSNDMRNSILHWKDAANVYYVDWNHKSNIVFPIYLGAVKGAMEVADDLKQIINNLKQAFPQWDSSDIHLIAHSLGSHVSGRLGYLMGGKIKQITAMDPPDSLQFDWPPEKKLTPDDAEFVLAMVTDAGGMGSVYSKADVTVLANGGYEQPGCNSLTGYLCRHNKVPLYNAYNMGKCIMVAYRADSYEQFLRGEVAYCEKDSDVCVGVGNWWQYDEGLQMSERIHFRPGPDWQSKRPANNGWRPYDKEYYLKLSADEPYCIFTYQVVIRFGQADAHLLGDINGLYVSLSIYHRNESGWTPDNDVRVQLVKMSNRRRQRKLSPRRSSRWRQRQEIVYTALALVESGHQLYKVMPAKFVRAILWLPNRVANGGKLVRRNEYPQVQVNYMSENRFERRQLYSGLPDTVYWYPPSRR